MSYDRRIGRIRLEVSNDGFRQQNYGYGCALSIRNGWNDSCEFVQNSLSFEELHDLRHLIERAIAQASARSEVLP